MRLAALLLLSLGMASAWAADQQDVYVEGVMGFKGETRLKPQFLSGVVVGYCPSQGLGLGVGVDQTFSLTSGNEVRSATQFYIEGRWFLEPVELAAGIGAQRRVRLSDEVVVRPHIVASGVYLIALTPSLAAKIEVRTQFLIDDQSSVDVMGGLGARVLY